MPYAETPSIEPPLHYPYITRRILHLFNEGALTNVTTVDVEPDYGYVTRINYADGRHRITYGNDLGLNPAAACDLAKDKGHTKFMLRTLGVECPEGEEFLLPTWAERVKASPRQRSNSDIKTTADADPYIQGNFGYPAYVKPVDGSKGAGIFKVYDQAGLAEAIEELETKKVRVAMVEKPVNMPDYRVVTLDGELISAYQRVPLTVIGDGERTISQLISELQRQYELEGRDTRLTPDDPRIVHHIGRLGLTPDSKLSPEEALALMPISNLSAGGTSVDVSGIINPRWVDLTSHIASNFNLRICGADLACEDIIAATSPYSILEVNSSPGLDHYAMSGEAQQQVVDDLYTRVLNVY